MIRSEAIKSQLLLGRRHGQRRAGRGRLPLHRSRIKLAAERYDSEDGLISRTPPLVAQIVTLRPSSSSDHDSSDESSEPEPLSPGSKPKRKRPKAQASRGDAVLIGFMGDLKYPDIANRAGEEVLPQSDHESESEVVESTQGEPAAGCQTQRSPSHSPPLRAEIKVTDSDGISKLTEPVSPRSQVLILQTEEGFVKPGKETRRYSDAVTQTLPPGGGECEKPARKESQDSADGPAGLGINGVSTGNLYQPSPSPGLSPSCNSPLIRTSTAPTGPQGSSEILPAMQASPMFDGSRSPGGQVGLPSLHDSGLKPLLDGRPPQNTVRVPLPPTSASAALSPQISSKTPRFPSPPERPGNTFSTKFPHGHPSPVYSNPSPGDSNHMSPPSRPSVQLPPFAARQDALTPQSADSYTSNGTSPGAGSDKLDIERSSRMLPPLVAQPGPSILNGVFRCKHPGCHAAPFQTQYLLK